jgi:hypothetical protein
VSICLVSGGEGELVYGIYDNAREGHGHILSREEARRMDFLTSNDGVATPIFTGGQLFHERYGTLDWTCHESRGYRCFD